MLLQKAQQFDIIPKYLNIDPIFELSNGVWKFFQMNTVFCKIKTDISYIFSQ